MTKAELKTIPLEFYNLTKAQKKSHPKARNVGQLIDQLNRLPKSLPVDSNWSHGVELVVYNINDDRPFLELCEVEEQ